MAEKTLEKMNMGELWALAKSRGIPIKGKKRKDLIKELSSEAVVKEEPKKKLRSKGKPAMVEATLADGTKILVPADVVRSSEPGKKKGTIIIRSVDGRELSVSVGRETWVGKEIEVPAEYEDEARRLLKEGGFFII